MYIVKTALISWGFLFLFAVSRQLEGDDKTTETPTEERTTTEKQPSTTSAYTPSTTTDNSSEETTTTPTPTHVPSRYPKTKPTYTTPKYFTPRPTFPTQTVTYEGDYETVDEHKEHEIIPTVPTTISPYPDICEGSFDAVGVLRGELFIFKNEVIVIFIIFHPIFFIKKA